MRITQAFKMALMAITSSKMRSFLTMLGIIIGVTSVTMLVSIAQGSTRSVTDRISSMGSTLLTCRITTQDDLGITLDSLLKLEGSGNVAKVAPLITSSVTTKGGGTTYATSIQGTTPEYLDIEGLSVSDGRFFNQVDMEYMNYVAVVGTDVADNLFSTRNCLGNYVEISGKKFLIIGVLTSSGSTTAGSKDDRIIIPFTTAQRLMKTKIITNFYATADSAKTVDKAKYTLESYLYSLTKDETSYSVFSESAVLSTMASVTNTLSLMLGGIACISLLVGGIGIMNIMLVSVSERTREIGVRKAIGAKRRDIMVQFLIEAMTISILGGVFGIVMGWAGIQIVAVVMNSTMTMSVPIALMALAFSVAVGVIFGLYPASKASRLRPIDALRYE